MTFNVRRTTAGLVLLALAGCGGGGVKDHVTSTVDHLRHPSAHSNDQFVATAHWSHPSDGYRIHVSPTKAGRRYASRFASRAFTQAVAAAGTTPFDITASERDSLTNQLKCHAVFASQKRRWNLEAWRPDVGYVRTVSALCNP